MFDAFSKTVIAADAGGSFVGADDLASLKTLVRVNLINT